MEIIKATKNDIETLMKIRLEMLKIGEFSKLSQMTVKVLMTKLAEHMHSS